MDEGLKRNRRHTRKKMAGEVSYKDDKKQSFGGCIAKDVSESGACIKIGEFFPVGTVLELSFKMPSSTGPCHVRGKIRWINKLPYGEQWEAGLEFETNTAYAALVQKYISFKEPQGSTPPPNKYPKKG
jgi:hypothetical protein